MADVSAQLEKTPSFRSRSRQKTTTDHVLKKRMPPRLPRRENDVYISNKSNYQSQISRCMKLLESGQNEIIIHGLGAAVTVAVNIALQLQDKFHGTVQLAVNTSTVDIVDDLEPVSEQAEFATQTRQNSSVHIRVYREALSGAKNKGCRLLCQKIKDPFLSDFQLMGCCRLELVLVLLTEWTASKNFNLQRYVVPTSILLQELVRWLGLTVFELWVQITSFTVFTLLLALKLEGIINSSWWLVFAPLFAADGLNAYFCTIVFIRMHLECMYKAALLRASWSISLLVLLFVFKFLLCKKLNTVGQGGGGLEFSEVLSPIFILLQLVAVRACQLH